MNKTRRHIARKRKREQERVRRCYQAFIEYEKALRLYAYHWFHDSVFPELVYRDARGKTQPFLVKTST
jgi:hypothetical protein